MIFICSYTYDVGLIRVHHECGVQFVVCDMIVWRDARTGGFGTSILSFISEILIYHPESKQR